MKTYYVNLLRKFICITTLVLSCSCASILFSCSSDEVVQNEDSVEVNELLNYSWSFTYKGNFYSYEMINGKLNCDEATKNILDKLKNMPNLCMHLDENSNVTYYDNQEEYLRNIATLNKRGVNTRALEEKNYYAIVKLYQHRNYRGKQINYEVNAKFPKIEVANLHILGWGDRISSIKMKADYEYESIMTAPGADLYVYDDFNFTGRTFTFHTNITETKFNDLRKYPLYPTSSSENWGDKISSLKFGYIER